MKYFLAAIMTICIITAANASTDSSDSFSDEVFRQQVFTSVFNGYISLLSTSPDPKDRERATDYSRYIECEKRNQKTDTATICYLRKETQ